MTGIYRHFENMCWPAPCEDLNNLEWIMRYETPDKTTCLLAASVVSAYRELIILPERMRNKRIRELRKGPNRKRHD